MPTVSGIDGPYRFYFYSFDCGEPRHVHVSRDRSSYKFWLRPVEMSSNYRFSPNELNRIRIKIIEHIDQISEAWDEHCGTE